MMEIEKILKDDRVQENRGIISMLRKEGLVERLDFEMFDSFGEEREFSRVKLCKVGSNKHNIHYVARIWMTVNIEKRYVDGLVSRREDVVIGIYNLLFNILNEIFHLIEKIILRGINDNGKSIDCFFEGPSEEPEKDVKNAAKILIDNLKGAGFRAPFALMSDFTTNKHVRSSQPVLTREGTLISRKRDITNIIDIAKWIQVFNNADKADDCKLVCFPQSKQNKPAFKLIERSPLEVYFRYNGGFNGNLNHVLDICWYGALKIDDPKSIQRINIDFHD